jgi:hypothetical protein
MMHALKRLINRRNMHILAAGFLLLIHVSLFVRLVCTYPAQLPYMDEWGLTELICKIIPFDLNSLWQQHNEHRLFFPKAFFYTLAQMTRWNIAYEVAALNLLLFATALILYFILQVRNEKGTMLACFSLMLILNFSQWENLVFGFQVSWIFILFCLMLACYLLQKGLNTLPEKVFIILLMILSAYSSMQGLLLSVFMTIYSIWHLWKTPRHIYYFVVIIFSVFIMLFYFYGWHKPVYHPSIFYGLRYPIDAILFLVVYIGNAYGPAPYVIVIAGSLTVVIFLYVFARVVLKEKGLEGTVGRLMKNPLLIMGAGVMLMIMIGRSGFGPAYGSASRYATFSALLNLGIWLFVIDAAREADLYGIRKISLALFFFVILISYYPNYQSAKWNLDRRSFLSKLGFKKLLILDSKMPMRAEFIP